MNMIYMYYICFRDDFLIKFGKKYFNAKNTCRTKCAPFLLYP